MGMQESHRVFPVSMDVISWLGAYYVRNEVYEKAEPFFDLASKIQPQVGCIQCFNNASMLQCN